MYDAGASERLAALIERANPVVRVDRAVLEGKLHDLLSAVGVPVDNSEAAQLWREVVGERQSHKELALAFRAIARAQDPLAPTMYHDDVLAGLNATARSRWSRRDRNRQPGCPRSLVGMSWARLDDERRS